MKKYDWLKMAVIVQAIGMTALAVVVMVHYIPYLAANNKNDDANQLHSDTQNEDEIVAVIADKEISRQQLVDELLELYGDQTLEHMLIHEAIRMTAQEKGITLSADELSRALAETIEGYESEEQYFDMMKKQFGLTHKRVMSDIEDDALLIKIATHDIVVSEQSIDNYLKEHYSEPKVKLSLSWILTDTYEHASEVVDQLSEGADFAELAEQHSLDPYSAEQGGNLGEIESDDPFFDAELLLEPSKLDVGSIAGPIALSDGYAIVQLLGKKTEVIKTPEEQREWAKQKLALQKVGSLSEFKQQLLNHYVTVIRK